MTQIEPSQAWDKVFSPSSQVIQQKISFHNRYGIALTGDLYIPKHPSDKKLPAVAVCGPFGAVKEQVSGLYAQTLAERGIAALAFDPSFTGESGGTPRYVASPDINIEDFSAAIDALSAQDNIDTSQLGIVGICGWGGFALSAAANDPRIKATVASTMYDMSRVSANGYFDQENSAQARYQKRQELCAQRSKDYAENSYMRAGGVADPLPEDVPQFVKDYHAYYKTQRGYHPRSLNSNQGWNVTSFLPFLNLPILSYIHEIRSAVLLVHGEQAHSYYFSKDAYAKLTGDNKEFLSIPDTSHCDLYDNLEKIPFNHIEAFLSKAFACSAS